MGMYKSLFFLTVFCLLILTNGRTVRFPIGGLFNYQTQTVSLIAYDKLSNRSTSVYGSIFSDLRDGFSTSINMCGKTQNNNSIVALIDARPTLGFCDNICLLCNKLNISHLSVAWEPPETLSSDDFTFSYHPPPEVISKAYATLIKDLNWEKFSFLYESEDSFIRLQEIINTWPNDVEPILFRKLDPNGDNKETFKHVFKVARRSYHVLDCEVKNIKKYIEEISFIENSTLYQNVLLTNLDAYTIDLKDFPNFDANTSTLHLTQASGIEGWKDIGMNTNKLTIRLETALVADALHHLEASIRSMMAVEEELQETEEYERRPVKYPDPPPLCVSNSKQDYEMKAWLPGNALRDKLLETTTKGFTGPIQFDENGRRTNFILHYSKMNSDNVFINSGTWESKKDAFIYVEPKIDYGFKPKSKLKVISKVGLPYFEERDGEYRGFIVDLMEAIFQNIRTKQHKDLTYEIRPPLEKYGNQIEGSRRWDGLIGELMEYKADMAACDLTITSERLAVVDFSKPFMNLGISMLFKKDPPPDPDMFSFVNPLGADVWLNLAVVYVVVSVVLLICARMSQDDWVNPHPCNQNPENLQNIWSLYNCMWLTMGSIMTQGCDILPRGVGSRWITGVWWFFAMIVTASYTANMSAFISSDRRSDIIDSVKKLSEQKDISYGALYNGSTYKFFQTSNDPVYQKIWQVMSSSKPTVFEPSNEAGKARVLRTKGGKYVFFMESTSIEYYTKRECHLKMVGNKFGGRDYGIAMPKNSRYLLLVDNAIVNLEETGVLKALKEKWWNQEDNPADCEDDSESSDEGSVQMKNTSGIFLVLGFGGILGLIMAIIGFLLHAHELCVKERITFREALASEWKSSLDPRVLHKPAAPPRSIAGSKSSTPHTERSRSRAVSVLKAAQSFINLKDVY